MRYSEGMSAPSELTTVFRTMDENAQEEAQRVRDLLIDAGIYAVVCDDRNPGVVEGTYEVQVPPAEAPRAESLLQADTEAAGDSTYEPLDPSHEMDLETLFSGEGTIAEIEANAIKGVLDAANIPAMIVGDSVLPNFPFAVRVPREHLEAARQTIAEAQAAGPAAAEEAERLTERPL